ncbi:MAG: hypothetical protein ACRC68_11265 [Clostridium sp.]
MNSSGSKTPYMGFVVEPYSYFLCYELKNIEMAQSFLPEGFELIKTRVFVDKEPKHYAILGCFNAHTSGFWGLRTEFYLIAENKKTAMLSWIIIDYDTNTITYDPKNILCDANAKGSILTTDFNGILHADIKTNHSRRLAFNSDIKTGKMYPLDKRLWVERNLSIAYGRNKYENDSGIFSLTFDPLEFEQALRIPLESVNIEENNWYPDLIENKPSEIVCFPYAQHFISDSPGNSSLILNENELIKKMNSINFDKVKVFSTEPIKKSFLISGLITALINLTLIIMLILK